MTREEWLNAAAVRLNEMIAEKTTLKPRTNVFVSTGWPRNDRKGKVVGQCWMRAAGKGVNHVFITPMIGSGSAVLSVLLHELIHAAVDKAGHQGEFRKAWKALGYEGKATEDSPGLELRKTLKSLAGELGTYPHKAINPTETGEKKQTTRMLKVAHPEGSECECVVRMTRKWLDEVGAPTCACGEAMMEVES